MAAQSPTECSCSGHCFDIGKPDISSRHTDDQAERPSHGLSEYRDRPKLVAYTPLQPWQTRILTLHPSRIFPPQSHADLDRIEADLLVVNLHCIEGVTVEGSLLNITYDALSYTWDSLQTTHEILCNGVPMPITRNLAYALAEIRKPTEKVYLWVDAICINQSDEKEKSVQVSKMLEIYKKANSVIAWLGVADMDSLVAVHCIHEHVQMERRLRDARKEKHSEKCLVKLAATYTALVALYSRPWLSRTWIRQEIYGARHLILQCGSQTIGCKNFLHAESLLDRMRKIVHPQKEAFAERDARIHFLLAEARKNVAAWHGVKAPRDLADVLLNSKHFAVEKEQDTFYAILGMCAVPTSSTLPPGEIQPPRHSSIVVDYSKTAEQVYHDASAYILSSFKGHEYLAAMWHPYLRSHQNSLLPTWAVDWRADRCSDEDLQLIQEKIRSDVEHRSMLTGNHSCWIPLAGTKTLYNRNYSTIQHRLPGPEYDRRWCRPEVSRSNPDILKVRGRALNYIAYVTEFTCDLAWFSESGDGCEGGFTLRTAAQMIYSRANRASHQNPFQELPARDITFVPGKHQRRIAILGLPDDNQIALIPHTARAGDIIVAVAPDLLPLVFRPLQGDAVSAGSLPAYDVYSHPSFGKRVKFLGLNALNGPSIVTTILIFCLIAVWGTVAIVLMNGSRMITDETAGICRIVFSVFVASLIGCWIVLVRLWLVIRRESGRRRSHITARLDQITQTLGTDYEFLGPSFARQCTWNLSIHHSLYHGECTVDQNWERPLQDFRVH